MAYLSTLGAREIRSRTPTSGIGVCAFLVPFMTTTNLSNYPHQEASHSTSLCSLKESLSHCITASTKDAYFGFSGPLERNNMISLGSLARIFICKDSTDMRKGFESLSAEVELLAPRELRDIVKSCVRESWTYPHSKISLCNFLLGFHFFSVFELDATDHLLNQLIPTQSVPMLLSRCC